jgi:hypothetical protein
VQGAVQRYRRLGRGRDWSELFMERSFHDWNVGFSDDWDGLNDDPFVQAVGSPTPARSRRNSLTSD